MKSMQQKKSGISVGLFLIDSRAFSAAAAFRSEPATDAHTLTIQQVEYDYVVSMEHPMEKTHFLSFFAYVTSDRISFIKCYPEQNPMVRFPMMGHGTIYSYCNRHGLFQVSV